MAQMIQAIGRIERVGGNPKHKGNVGIQYIGVTSEIREDFEYFFAHPQYSATIELLEPFLSDVIQKYVAGLELSPKESQEQVLSLLNDRCEREVERLYLSKFKEYRLGAETSQNLPNKWQNLRKAALSHDFQDALLQKCKAVIKFDQGITEHSFSEGQVEGQFSPNSINQIFRKFRQVKELRDHFHQQGFQLEYRRQGNFQFFVPHFLQSVYIPTLAEESVRALLRKKGLQAVHPDSLNTRLWELSDLVIPKAEFFIDVKYYSPQTVAGLEFAHAGAKELSKDGIISTGIKKIEFLKGLDFTNPRLVFINMFGESGASLKMVNAKGDFTNNYAQSVLVFVPGAIDQGKLDVLVKEKGNTDPVVMAEECLHSGFRQLITYLDEN